MLTPSKDAIDLIEEFEGFRPKAYPDPKTGGEPITIGKGTTVYRTAGLAKYGRTKVRMGDTLTLEEANQEFEAFLKIISSRLNATGAKLTQSQFDAAISFCYNTGFPEPQMRRLRAGDLDGFHKFMPRYIDEGTSVEDGLRRRRKAEQALWKKDNTPMVTWIALTQKSGDGKTTNVLRGLSGAALVAEHTWSTKDELIALLQKYPGAKTAQVTVENWAPSPEPQPADTARLIKTTTRLPGNLFQLLFKVGDKSFPCVSGQGDVQNFRRPQDPRSVPGNREPLPQGRYRIGPPQWKAGKDNWNASWGPGLGPVWLDLDATFSDDRGAFGIHRDDAGPGSAGCVVFSQTVLTELLRVIGTVKLLDVDWGL